MNNDEKSRAIPNICIANIIHKPVRLHGSIAANGKDY